MAEMSEQPVIHVCRGVGRRYQARARWYGYRQYELIGKPTRSYRVALRHMADAFATGNYKRADVIFWDDYYDAEVACELVRR